MLYLFLLFVIILLIFFISLFNVVLLFILKFLIILIGWKCYGFGFLGKFFMLVICFYYCNFLICLILVFYSYSSFFINGDNVFYLFRLLFYLFLYCMMRWERVLVIYGVFCVCFNFCVVIFLL